MGLFGRKKDAGATLVSTLGGAGSLPPDTVAARLVVVAVTQPGVPRQGEAALISGMLIGPFGVKLPQVTVAMPRALWPQPGQELPAVADPRNPMNFGVVWSTHAERGTNAALNAAKKMWRPGPGGWDDGPGGDHTRQVADWLAAAGFTAGDFGTALDTTAPRLKVLLDQAASRYATVVPGKHAVALMRNGRPAQGTVAAVVPLSVPVEMLPSPEASMAWLTLNVTAQDGVSYQSTIRFGFRNRERFTMLATVGTALPLRVDPADRNQITIDLPALGITPG